MDATGHKGHKRSLQPLLCLSNAGLISEKENALDWGVLPTTTSLLTTVLNANKQGFLISCYGQLDIFFLTTFSYIFHIGLQMDKSLWDVFIRHVHGKKTFYLFNSIY